MFGGMLGRDSLNEESNFVPKSPYAAAKVFAHHAAQIYRNSYDMFLANGILFNHESPRRGENFVSRKITLAVARISLGMQKKLLLGNIEAKRDWGHAKEYIRAIRLIVEAPNPDDYVVATGKFHSVRDFVKLAFDFVDLDWEKFLEIDPKLFRPNEVEDLLGNPSKIANNLGWHHEMELKQLVDDMMRADLHMLGAKNGMY